MTTQTEIQLRRKLIQKGYLLQKSRKRKTAENNINDLGGYMIVDANYNAVIAGSRFELTLEDVEIFVKEGV